VKGQGNLFENLPPPGKAPQRFVPARHPIWTENKAKLIERYLYYFVLVTKHGAYVDGFSAPQYVDRPESWAAKLVLESKPQYLRNFWLCDIDPEGVRRLEELVAQQPRVRGRTIQVVPGDFNETVRLLLEQSDIGENTAAFSLLDQRTFECEWGTLQTLARHKKGNKIELFYFLGTGWLDRAMRATTSDRERIARWWGRDDWPALIGMRSRDRAELFCKRFREELGYTHAYPFEIYSAKLAVESCIT
jgi:three-Cys-motif partner protein